MKLRQLAEKDLRLSDCALRLLFRIYSDRVLSPDPVTDAFPLPWKQVAHWCGLNDAHVSLARLSELITHGYLYLEGLKGCPATNWFKLNLKRETELRALVKPGLDGTFRDGVIPSARRPGNKDALIRKGLAALREAAK